MSVLKRSASFTESYSESESESESRHNGHGERNTWGKEQNFSPLLYSLLSVSLFNCAPNQIIEVNSEYRPQCDLVWVMQRLINPWRYFSSTHSGNPKISGSKTLEAIQWSIRHNEERSTHQRQVIFLSNVWPRQITSKCWVLRIFFQVHTNSLTDDYFVLFPKEAF